MGAREIERNRRREMERIFLGGKEKSRFLTRVLPSSACPRSVRPSQCSAALAALASLLLPSFLPRALRAAVSCRSRMGQSVACGIATTPNVWSSDRGARFEGALRLHRTKQRSPCVALLVLRRDVAGSPACRTTRALHLPPLLRRSILATATHGAPQLCTPPP